MPNSMVSLLQHESLRHGGKLQMLSARRLADLEADIVKFAEAEDLNSFQKYIVNNIYSFESQDDGFTARSIIVIATPTPAYARVEFEWQGIRHPATSLAMSEMGGEHAFTVTRRYLENILSPMGYRIQSAPNLPLKRLAVRSGLAVYGRNNICYTDGMGSFFTLTAYYTDLSCLEDDWTDIRQAAPCADCSACINNCPTHAIREDRFLIDNEKCLSFFNEGPGEIPEWVPLSAFQCVYDCLECQAGCPMNAEYIDHVIGPIIFSEAETAMILEDKGFHAFDPALQKKVEVLGMTQWLPVIPRNLKILFELERTPHG